MTHRGDASLAVMIVGHFVARADILLLSVRLVVVYYGLLTTLY